MSNEQNMDLEEVTKDDFKNYTNQVCLLVLHWGAQCLLHEDEVWLQLQT